MTTDRTYVYKPHPTTSAYCGPNQAQHWACNGRRRPHDGLGYRPCECPCHLKTQAGKPLTPRG